MNYIQTAYRFITSDIRYTIAFIAVLVLIVWLVYDNRNVFMTIDDRIKKVAREEFKFPENLQQLLVAQAKHETANYTSAVFRENNNLYGYKYVSGAKYQSSAGRTSTEGNAYASYDSIENSIREVCAWIVRRQNEGKFPQLLSSLTAITYAQYLKNSGYYGDSVANYTKGLTSFLS